MWQVRWVLAALGLVRLAKQVVELWLRKALARVAVRQVWVGRQPAELDLCVGLLLEAMFGLLAVKEMQGWVSLWRVSAMRSAEVR